MINRFKDYIREKKLITTNDRVLAAVSGGIDSMVMAHLLIEAGLKPGIAHCNFCLRDEESDGDEQFVRAFAGKNKLPFFTVRFDTSGYAAENHISIQMAARDLRYGWFEKIRNENGYTRIAVAHNLNDNIETLILNLTRGTGLTGLSGIKPSSGHIIRPLLFATREEITSHSKERKIDFREDRSNAQTKYIRNKIRHRIIPLLKEINPSAETALNETALRIAELDEFTGRKINDIRNGIISQGDEDITINIRELTKEAINRSVLFELFLPWGISGNNLHELEKVIKGRTGARLMTPDHIITKNRGQIIISPIKQSEPMYFSAATVDDLPSVPIIESAVYLDRSGMAGIPAASDIACLDADEVTFPVTIRKKEAGDYFYPLGMDRKKKLSDFLIDLRVSLPEKEKILVMESANRIVWVMGWRIDNRFRITGSTKRILMIKLRSSVR